MKKRTVITTEEREVCIISEATPKELWQSADASPEVSTPSSLEFENTSFTLSGSDHKEISFFIPGPGRIDLNVVWQADSGSSKQQKLITSLIEPGKIEALVTLSSTSPILMQQQLSSGQTGRRKSWTVKVQNSSETKVNGRVRITYTPNR